MRRAIIILAFVWLSGCPLFAQTEAEQSGLKGRVKTVHVEEAKLTDASGNLIEGQRIISSVASFNERGSMTGQTFYNPDGSLKWKRSWVYTYGAQGEEAETLYLNEDDKSTARGVSTYDKKGRKNRLTLYNPNGSVNHTETYTYDDLGNKIKEIHRNPGGTARSKITYSYDAQGRLIKTSFYKPDGTLDQGNVYEYDAQGRETKWAAYHGDESITAKIVRGYGVKSNRVEATYYQAGNAVMINKETFTDDEFDAQGNWTKRSSLREIISGEKTRRESVIVYRKITYF